MWGARLQQATGRGSSQRGLGTRSRTASWVSVFCPKAYHGKLLHVQRRDQPCLCRDTAPSLRAGYEDLSLRLSAEPVRGTERAGCPGWLGGGGVGHRVRLRGCDTWSRRCSASTRPSGQGGGGHQADQRTHSLGPVQPEWASMGKKISPPLFFEGEGCL